MTDRSELALQLTDAIAVARTAVERAGDRAFRAYGLSHRAHAALNAVDQGGPDGARPKDIAAALGVSRAAATTFMQRLSSKGVAETNPDPEDARGAGGTLTPHRAEEVLPDHPGSGGRGGRAGDAHPARAGGAAAGRPARAAARRPRHRGDAGIQYRSSRACAGRIQAAARGKADRGGALRGGGERPGVGGMGLRVCVSLCTPRMAPAPPPAGGENT